MGPGLGDIPGCLRCIQEHQEGRGTTRDTRQVDVAAAKLRRARELRRAGLLADEDHGILIGYVLAASFSHGSFHEREVQEAARGMERSDARRYDRAESHGRDRR